MKNFIVFVLCLSTAYLALGQEQKETIAKDISFRNGGSNPVLQVDNINGDVLVEAYDGNTIQLQVEKTIKGKTAGDLDRAKQEVKLGIEQAGDSVLVFIDGPMLYRRGPTGWRRYSENNMNWDRDYSYEFNFKIKVPARTHLFISTINDGDVRVDKTQGVVHASNVNGPLYLTGIVGTTRAHTVNGDIEVAYRQTPPQVCSYQTINGNIAVSYPANLSADLRFKTQNGEAYTDFEAVEELSATVEKINHATKGNSYRYRSGAGLRIGKGGPEHSFETLNGDITIKKIK
jgi:DUF4097 and DUF4098 domain-containing protein YvlB